MVVEGFITDSYGPHNIRITRITKFAGVLDGGVFNVEEADVRIIDQNGQSTKLNRIYVTEKRIGACGSVFATVLTDYRTPANFKGEIGAFYTLEFVTNEGAIYRSNPQEMLPTPPIDSLSLAFKELPSLDPNEQESGVEIFASWLDPIESENFYFWRVNGIYKINTPDRSNEGFCCGYDPVDGGAMHCWIVEKNIKSNTVAFSDQRANGQKITLPVGLIEDNGLRFADRTFVTSEKQYFVEVEQYAVSEEVFEFNSRIDVLNEINGEIFDAPPLSVRGNVFNVNNPNETVIGYFGAYAKQTKETFIPLSMLKFVQRFPKPCGDCRARPGAQTETPEPYKN